MTSEHNQSKMLNNSIYMNSLQNTEMTTENTAKMPPPTTLQDFGSSLPFPVKLHRLLQDASRLGFDDIVCWQPGGTCFKVLQPDRFAEEIMQRYFQQTKYKSFQRQINTYGFMRVHHGPMKGSYTHPMFTRENPNFQITRKQKRSRKKATKKLSDEYSFQPKEDSLWNLASDDSSSSSAPKDEDPFFLPFGGGDDEISLNEMDDMLSNLLPTNGGNKLVYKNHESSDSSLDGGLPSPVDIATIPTAARRATIQALSRGQDDNDSTSYQAYLQSVPTGIAENQNQSHHLSTQRDRRIHNMQDESGDSSSSDRYFPQKLHIMLEAAESKHFSDIVSWVHNGTAFKVHKRKDFVEKVMPDYFDQTQFESFRRQLNMYGFSRINKGKDRGIVSHMYFVKGQRSLCDKITRVGKPGGAR